MKKMFLCFGLFFLTVSSSAYAATGSVSMADVQSVTVSISSTAYSKITLENWSGTGATGNCYQPPAAVRQFVLPPTAQGDKMRQILLSAFLSEMKVKISWNDTQTTTINGHAYCIVQEVYINRP